MVPGCPIFILLMKLFLKVLRSLGIYYSTPTGLSGLWSFGVGALIFFVVQVVTGLLLVSYYIPYIIYAASSIEPMMRDVYLGWLLRYLHISGASFFFFIIYVHVIRGLYFGSFNYPRKRKFSHFFKIRTEIAKFGKDQLLNFPWTVLLFGIVYVGMAGIAYLNHKLGPGTVDPSIIVDNYDSSSTSSSSTESWPEDIEGSKTSKTKLWSDEFDPDSFDRTSKQEFRSPIEPQEEAQRTPMEMENEHGSESPSESDESITFTEAELREEAQRITELREEAQRIIELWEEAFEENIHQEEASEDEENIHQEEAQDENIHQEEAQDENIHQEEAQDENIHQEEAQDEDIHQEEVSEENIHQEPSEENIHQEEKFREGQFDHARQAEAQADHQEQAPQEPQADHQEQAPQEPQADHQEQAPQEQDPKNISLPFSPETLQLNKRDPQPKRPGDEKVFHNKKNWSILKTEATASSSGSTNHVQKEIHRRGEEIKREHFFHHEVRLRTGRTGEHRQQGENLQNTYNALEKTASTTTPKSFVRPNTIEEYPNPKSFVTPDTVEEYRRNHAEFQRIDLADRAANLAEEIKLANKDRANMGLPAMDLDRLAKFEKLSKEAKDLPVDTGRCDAVDYHNGEIDFLFNRQQNLKEMDITETEKERKDRLDTEADEAKTRARAAAQRAKADAKKLKIDNKKAAKKSKRK